MRETAVNSSGLFIERKKYNWKNAIVVIVLVVDFVAIDIFVVLLLLIRLTWNLR